MGYNRSHPVRRGIGRHSDGQVWVIVSEHPSRGQVILGLLKSFCTLRRPIPFGVRSEKCIQGMQGSGQVGDKFPIIIEQTQKGSKLGDIGGGWRLCDGFRFVGENSNAIFADVMPQELHRRQKEGTLFLLQAETMLLQPHKDFFEAA